VNKLWSFVQIQKGPAMTSDKKWREFWLQAGTIFNNKRDAEYMQNTTLYPYVHVIEVDALIEANAKIEWLKEKISKLHEDVSSSGTIGVMYGYEQAKDKIESQKQIIEKLKGALKRAINAIDNPHTAVHEAPGEGLGSYAKRKAKEALKQVEEMEQK